MPIGINPRPDPWPECPDLDCGAQMVLRRPKRGQTWNPFWGCSNWPTCKCTREIGEDGNPVVDEIDPDQEGGWL